MATINHIRVARLNPAIARECEQGHPASGGGHPYGVAAPPRVDPYTRRSNICPLCHTARSVNGLCLCD